MPKGTAKELDKLITSQRTCVIGSVDEQGIPNIKAMLKPRKITGIKTFYFSTNTSSQHARQYLINPKASIYFHKRFLFYRGALLKGYMEILTDDDVKRMLWEKGDEKYYPGGVTDPD
ncbi:MAG: pyridoxamine 5'-phosphate oxidase family protein, partial [Oscillospiraceae bacterium]|nr:pyridoxamine 5'-phosphate oxidase family protein [Oscillospiraceae bacterium]